ncbi:MAG: hypothetical protein IJY39_11740 [Clostridia bacterium]|nr:hypothetical protein [Clostridia bacterium]
MKNKKLSFLSLLLAIVTCASLFAACGPATSEDSSSSTNDTEQKTEGTEAIGTEETESNTSAVETEEDTTPKLEGEYALLIENADRLKNDVTSYFTNAAREYYRIENNNMNLDYVLTSAQDQLATITNKKGGTYIEDTMDVFIKMKSGKTYYASGSQISATANLYRYGYYYYDAQFYNQNFVNEITVTDKQPVKLALFRGAHDMSRPEVTNGVLSTTIESTADPYITAANLKISTEKYNALQITMKTTSSTEVNMFFVAGSHGGFSEDQRIDFQPIPDGEFHTYTIYFSAGVNDYTGTLSQLRFDFNGIVGETVEISEITALSTNNNDAPSIVMGRNLHVYSDKMHQVIRLIAEKDTTDIAEVGMITKIAASTVDKLIVKDKNGLHEKLDGVDWASAEYIGFDVKNVGIFGYILPLHKESGSMTVALEGENYVITQTTTPEDGTILAPIPASSNKDQVVINFKGQSNDPYHSVNEFDFGQRIYTDATHSFDAFLHEAECERNPLTSDNIKINTEKTAKATFDGYDPLRGIYCFTVPESTGFNAAFYNHPNKHCPLSFSITGDDKDRDIYVLAYAFTTSIECAAVLDKNDMMLPIPIEVSKNFSNEFEEPVFAWGDIRYGEARIPMVIKSGETQELTILHLYQNWGNYPLKQISSIQFFAPYYHLSTGCTESNCISSYYVYSKDLQMLPDHRAMSAPIWATDPQHTNGGNHSYLQYTDADGNYYATEDIVNVIESAGPTYADIELNYLSDDGKIMATYTHMEFPQVDENRTFYEMEYEVLEDVSFKNFATDFSFYAVRAINGNYVKVGYLDENNKPAIVSTGKNGEETLYKLGDEYPYFDMFQIPELDDYVNVSFIIRDAKIVIGGKEVDPGFVIVEKGHKTRLSLDLGEVTLKKGDHITIHAIIMPWGSQETDYSAKQPDINVLNVRQDSIIDPLKVTAGANAETIDSVWLPKIKSTDGKSAEFTLSGGENNVAFRVYGFKMLTAPKLYEKIDGEWVLIDVSSLNNPDKEGNYHAYDGYAVHYDSDGTFSYSFVTTLTGDQKRTFKVVADEEFKGWPEQNIVVEDPTDIYFNPTEIGYSATASQATYEIDKDGQYIRIFGDGESPEKYFSFNVSTDSGITGQYAIIKYRLPVENDTDLGHFQIYTGTKSPAIVGTGDWLVARDVKKDGQWHVMVIDISAFNLPEYVANADGTYSAKYFRFDLFNAKMSESSYIDVAYIAMCDSLDKIMEFNQDILSVELVESEYGSKTVYTASGSSEPTAEDLLNVYIGASALKATSTSGTGKVELLTEDKTEFVRYWGDGAAAEAYSNIYNGDGKVSGKYIVIKYRIPTTNTENPDNGYIEFFTSTVNGSPKGFGPESDYVATLGQKLLIKDGEWHTLVLDVTTYSTCTTFVPAEDGTYTAKFIRFDMFNGQTMSTSSYMDVAFVGMCEDPTPFLPEEE